MVLLGRLAVASERQSEGIGRDLLVDALWRAVYAAAGIAARFIAVDPIDEGAREFYRHFGFKDVEGDAEGRMFLTIAEVRATFGAS